MTEQEIYTVVLAAKGEAEASKLAAKARELESELKDLESAYARGAVQAQVYASAMDRIAAAQGRLANEVKSMTAQAGTGMKNLGQGLQQVGYIADDIQYGLNGVINNIQPLISSLGGGAGLAGAVGLATVAGYQLYRHWDDLARLFGTGAARTQAEEMAELADATERTAEQSERLLKYQRDQASITTQRQGRSPEEKALADAVNSAVGENRADLIRGLAQTNQSRFENMPDALAPGMGEKVRQRDEIERKLRGDYREGEEMTPRASLQSDLGKLQAEIANMVHKLAEGELGAAANDPSKARALRDLISGNPGAFGPDAMKTAGKIMGGLPETIEGEAANKKEEERAKFRKKDLDRQKALIERVFGTAHSEGEMSADLRRGDAQAEREAKQEDRIRKERENYAKQPIMGSGDILSSLLMSASKAGIGTGGISGRMMASLMGTAGVSATDASRLVGEANAEARNKMINEDLEKRLPSKIRNSETFGAGTEKIDRIQAAVTNENAPMRLLNEAMKQTVKLQQLIEETRRRGGLTLR